ncbi:hypothetical protein LXH13_23700 [Streptomyces spinosirectus]|jgi:hypothetical protein|uniref:hypothetical protein n=1 Tax=Streptomyces TaxID=1883 RepID=UPI000D33C481|nr:MULTISPECIES: hypothetical protein [Streptomyces]MBY8343563.1 hypothetical protein [Streptomyces plumbidurans]PTM97975.1 hypothetical protein C7821_103187 [Streptomyces sp. VMFN-G11Ma]UIR19861.1 hypothetical protein LXH13_23700 [Streptomyces spinosirectus]
MPDEHVSVFQSLGVVILALAAAVWVFGLISLARRGHFGPVPRVIGGSPRALVHQRRSAPYVEYVELTPAEQAAFAGLVRQLKRR